MEGADRPHRHQLVGGELRVARLAACGQSNRSIAETLTVAERTVEAQLYMSFGKLGIHHREQLGSHPP